MLEGMVQEGEKARQEEQVVFARFESWCATESDDQKRSILGSKEKLERVTAEIDAKTAENEEHQRGISENQAKIVKTEAIQKEQRHRRKVDLAEHEAMELDLSESVSALRRAIETLERGADAPSALLQLSEDAQQKSLRSLVQLLSTDGVVSTPFSPEPKAYESQSGGVVSTLKELLEKFSAELNQHRTEEANSRHAFEMVMEDTKAAIDTATEMVSLHTTRSNDLTKELVVANTRQAAVNSSLAKAEATLAAVVRECTEKKASHKESQQVRSDELDALLQAIEILKSDDMSVQGLAPSPSSLAQLRRFSVADPRERSVERARLMLSTAGARLSSPALVEFAGRVTGPFDKVKRLIEDLIAQLMDEASAETSHKAYCDKEQGANAIALEKHTRDQERLQESVAANQARELNLAQSRSSLTEQIARDKHALEEARENRLEEHHENAKAVEEAKAAQEALKQAMTILTEFFRVAGSKSGNDVYTGQQDRAEGVLGLLEVILSDVANFQAATESGEVAAVRQHEALVSELTTSIALAEQQVSQAQHETVRVKSEISSDAGDLHATEKRRAAVVREQGALESQCGLGVTHKDRAAARESEIQSLKEALRILTA